MDKRVSWFTVTGWVATVLSLAGYWLIVRVNVWGFVVCTVANIIFAWRFYRARDWSQIAFFAAYTALNAIGLYEWFGN